jgi:gag-polypeptide of LTR copia-type
MSWAKSATFALSGRGRLGHITGTKKTVPQDEANPTDAENQLIKEWQMTGYSVITWILASIEPSLSKMFLYTKSAKELWKKIENMHGQQNNYNHIYQLKQEIYQAKKDNKSHTEYLVELTAKFDELDEFLPLTTDPKEIEKRREQDKIDIYLGGLDSSYEAVRSQILLSTELPSFSAVVAMVHREDERMIAMNPELQEPRHARENQALSPPLLTLIQIGGGIEEARREISALTANAAGTLARGAGFSILISDLDGDGGWKKKKESKEARVES